MAGKHELNIAWSPLPGSQTKFLTCPFFEVLFHGNKGPGKSDALIMCFAQHIGKFGPDWKGIILRQSSRHLEEIKNKSRKWFHTIFGDDAVYNIQESRWEWKTGEKLYFRHMSRDSDYWAIHGHEYPFIGWDELTNWPTPFCYLSVMSCCRTTNPAVPRMIRATTNPFGVGHSWIRKRFNIFGDYTRTIVREPDDEIKHYRVAIYGNVIENTYLMKSNPDYLDTLIASASNPSMMKAWVHGDWDIVSGGMFSDVWNNENNIVQSFDIPCSWRIDRSFDWGSSRPFAVGWWAESDGTDYRDLCGNRRTTVRGDLFRIMEWYGAEKSTENTGLKMLATEISRGIAERETAAGIAGRVKPGPADNSIFDVVNGKSIAEDMKIPFIMRNGIKSRGISWNRSDKSPGSRISGWERMRRYIKHATPQETGPRENPGLFVFENCDDFIRIVPGLPRDKIKMDDLDTNCEDHLADEARYRIHNPPHVSSTGRITGAYHG